MFELEILETEHGVFTNSETESVQEIYDKWLNDNFDFVDGEWIKKEQIDNCPVKTVEERLAEAEQKLEDTKQKLEKSEEEKKLLKAQVEANTSTQEFLESCLMEVAKVVYA